MLHADTLWRVPSSVDYMYKSCGVRTDTVTLRKHRSLGLLAIAGLSCKYLRVITYVLKT